ncbi:SGNH hydrolase domain-containing protein [Arthrobacter sp. SAFR-014]|uniref:SGNH hydrolase domain-containing protein n=1 Tax=unclassified Arthrobacter TaxID=235627 RepID=UPI003F7B7982
METDRPCDADKLGGIIQPQVDRYAEDTGSAFACWRAQGKPLATCSIGSSKSDALSVALIGDSHAASLIPSLEPILEQKNWKLDVFVGYGCPWMQLEPDSDCYEVMQEIQKRVDTGKKYDAIITTASRSKMGEDKDHAAEMLAAAWKPAADRGTRIIAVGDVPLVSDDALACITRIGFDVKNTQCGTDVAEATGSLDPLVKAASLVDGARLIQMSPFLCTEKLCPSVIGHVIVYRDAEAHLTSTFAKTLSPYLSSSFSSALKP